MSLNTADHSLPYYLIITSILFISTFVFSRWYQLRQFSGPPLAWLSPLWMTKKMLTMQSHLAFYEVSKKYGNLCRIAPRWLLTNDPEVVFQMGKVRSEFAKSEFYDGLEVDPGARTIVLETNVIRHDKLRSMMAAAYGSKENPDLEGHVDERIRDLVAAIERKYLSTATMLRPADFAKLIQFVTLDILTDFAFGAPFGYLERDEDVHGWIKERHESLTATAVLGTLPWVARIANNKWVRSVTGPWETDEKGLGKILGIARSVAAERFGPKKVERQDMLGSFVRNGLTEREARTEAVTQIVAGGDPTATLIRMSLLHIISNPRILSKLRAEIDDYLEANPSAKEHAAIIPSAKVRNELPYLQACIREGLRIFPPFAGLLAKVVPPSGDILAGHHVPGGTRVGIAVWAIQRNEVYGKNTDIYDPERWLEADEERGAKMSRTLETIFGMGKYKCLGRNVTWLGAEKVLFEMFRRFDFTVLDPLNPIKSSNMLFFSQWDMMLRIVRRRDGGIEA